MLETLREQYEILESKAAESRMDTSEVVIDAGYGQRNCPVCGTATHVQKTSRRNVETLVHRHFVALEHVTKCPNRCLYPNGKTVIGHSEELAKLVPHGARYGYDIEVFVGIERFLKNAQRDEIREKLLSQYGIDISTGEISKLAARFLKHIEMLHYQQAALIRSAMEMDGGYTLHIDATTEGGKGTMFVAYSGWRHWALGAWKIPSEHSDHIEPHITRIAKLFGEPCAIVRDLGKAMKKAADEAGEKMTSPPRQLVCHYHFLQDVGCGLLDKGYGRLRELTREHNVRKNIQTIIRSLRQGVNTDDLAKFQRVFDSFISGEGSQHIADCTPDVNVNNLSSQVGL